ncbi:MAG: DUF2851 family protein [Chitinophagaceae bacterium]|nr:DUF2851 family protein [Chitinophagaceae bacterium]MBK8951693.1 DUF2851 family protein [Chitinophagaceae bacterium]
MNERLLHFIWQFQYFNKSRLSTIAGEEVTISFPGNYNTNQGPDFSNAKIRIGKTTWAGAVELHLKTSDWRKHKHKDDNNYNNVMLHVVWEHDKEEANIPVLELKGRVSKILLQRYEEMMNAQSFIPCEKSISTVRIITWKSWKDRLVAERLIRKSALAESFLKETNYHWEETFWWLLARNFGITVNAEAFETIARSIPVNFLAKNKNQVHQLEALLLGQSGLLKAAFVEDYPKMLQKEYGFLKQKYNLKPVNILVHFLRMRPGNFPTVRLAQLAMLVHHSAHLFSKIKEAESVKDVRTWFDVTANDYWHYHYRFDEESAFKKKKLGSAMIDNIIINTICPVLFAYGAYHNEQRYKDKALLWLEQTAAEANNITNGFQLLTIENKTSFDSQALIELKNEYCNKKRCLECSVGNVLLKADSRS